MTRQYKARYEELITKIEELTQQRDENMKKIEKLDEELSEVLEEHLKIDETKTEEIKLLSTKLIDMTNDFKKLLEETQKLMIDKIAEA